MLEAREGRVADSRETLSTVRRVRAGSLAELCARFPVPSAVKELETLDEVAELDGVSIRMVGLSATLVDGSVLTGAAADTTGSPHERSYFELLERLAISEERRPESAPRGTQRISISNGVALFVDPESARRRAALELIERDRVLRSWYGATRPCRVREFEPWPTELERQYDIGAYRFDSGVDLGGVPCEVAGVLAFPCGPDAPLSVGFAARETLKDAIAAAARECLQQVAFGWGEPVPEAPPEESSSPEFHLDFYSYPAHRRLLEAWLEGEHEGRGPELPDSSGHFEFSDLTPAWMRGELSVVRASHPKAVPLVFGVGHPWFPELPECMRVHPIA